MCLCVLLRIILIQSNILTFPKLCNEYDDFAILTLEIYLAERIPPSYS